MSARQVMVVNPAESYTSENILDDQAASMPVAESFSNRMLWQSDSFSRSDSADIVVYRMIRITSS